MYRLLWTNARHAPQPDLLHRARLRRLGRRGDALPAQAARRPARSGNFWTLQHAQLYTEPERLAKAGYLTERRERGGRRRKLYEITDAGRAALDELARRAHRRDLRAARPGAAQAVLRRRPGGAGADPGRGPPAQARRVRAASATRCPSRSPTARGWRSTPASPPSGSRSSGGRRLRSRRMATAAEPRPAELPLPGGREGARVKLHPLLTGQMIGPEAWFLREEGRLAWRRAFGLGVKREDWLDVPVPAFLVEHPGAGPILIDTGFHPSVAAKPTREPRPARADHLQGHPDDRRPGGLGAAARARHPARGRQGRPDDPPARRPRQRDLGVPRTRRSWSARPSGRPRPSTASSTATSSASSTTASTTGCSTSRAPGLPSRSRASPARSTSSATAACARSTRPDTRSGTCRWYCARRAREVLIAADAIYMRRTLEDTRLPYRTADEHLFRRSLREIRQYAHRDARRR